MYADRGFVSGHDRGQARAKPSAAAKTGGTQTAGGGSATRIVSGPGVTLDSAAREGRGESWYVYWKAHEEEQRLRSDVPIFSASSTYANATLWDGTSAIDANLTLTDASNIVLLYCSGGFSPPPHSTIPATQATG